MNRASGVASTPYQGYGGEETAPINDQQRAGFGAINTAQGNITATGAPISAEDIQRYQDPYTSSVIDATQKDFDVQNARQQSQTTGNAAAQGALGGDRSAVAAALTAEGQSRSQAPVIAGLRSQGYQNAVKTAEDQQQQALRAGVAGLQGGQAMVGAGTLEQQTQQAKDTQGRMDYYQQQGYPFQVAQWLAQMDTGVGSQMGGTGTSTGTAVKQGPTPNPWSQVAGMALAGAGMFAADGGRISGVHRFADGGAIRLSDDEMHAFREWKAKHYPEAGVHGYAGGGSPWGGDQTWIPQVGGITGGRGAPQAPSLPSDPGSPEQSKGPSADQMKGIGAVGKKMAGGLDFGGMSGAMAAGDPLSGDSWGGGSFASGDAWGGSGSNPLPGLSADDYGMERGGRVRRYATGGSPLLEEDDGVYRPMAAGVGASRPAFGVVNPDEPFRMLDKPSIDAEPPALDNWRGGVDRDVGVGQSSQNDVPLPPEVISGRSKPPVIARGAPEDGQDEPSAAMGYSDRQRLVPGVGAPAAAPEGGQDGGFLSRLGVKMTPELKQGLLQAGLAMMATRHGGPGSFLSSAGEAGMAGVGAYNATQQAQLDQAEKARKEGFEREKFERPYSEMTAAQRATDRRTKESQDRPYNEMTAAQKAADQRAKEAAEREKVPFGWKVNDDGTITRTKGGPQDPEVIREQNEAKQSGGISDAAVEVMARQGASGDQSWAKNIGRGAQSAKTIERVRNRMAGILIDENGKTPAEAAKVISEATRDWGASQIASNAGARTRATRVANLDMILEVADSAVPAALEASQKLSRTGFVPLNKIIEKGRVMTSNPEQAEFGIANLQLAEGWARAMNPTGVMRESDRDKALEFLGTATSADTYERAVKQIQKQIHREKDAISRGHSPKDNAKTETGDIPSPKAIELLATDPKKYKDDFEKRYGKGSADRFGGG